MLKHKKNVSGTGIIVYSQILYKLKPNIADIFPDELDCCASYNLNKNIHNVLVNIKEHFCLTKSERIDCLFMLCEHRLPGPCVSGNLD